MANKIIYIPNYDSQNYPFFRLQLVVKTQLNEPTKINSIKVPKVVMPTKKKIIMKLWGLV